MQTQRRSGFTLIELLAVMLLILTVLAMGVPALFASERKSYANQAMSELIRVHQACMAMQVYLATIGNPGIINLTIAKDSSLQDWQVKVTVTPTPNDFDPRKWMGMTLGANTNEFIASISAEQFIGDITATSSQLNWTYQPKTGFPVFPTTPTAVNTLTFKALPLSGVYKMTRTLNLYPLGYSEIP
jgi:prepilin-type N-terminal cleavage/methylation domain-containing protein